jgi:hypothetical protein
VLLTRSDNQKASESLAGQVLDRWHLTVSAAGVLRIAPEGPSLAPDELASLIDRLACCENGHMLAEIVFDLGHVQRLGPRYTGVLALLIDFAQRCAASCRVESVRGQPAHVLRLYRYTPAVLSLLRGGIRA